MKQFRKSLSRLLSRIQSRTDPGESSKNIPFMLFKGPEGVETEAERVWPKKSSNRRSGIDQLTIANLYSVNLEAVYAGVLFGEGGSFTNDVAVFEKIPCINRAEEFSWHEEIVPPPSSVSDSSEKEGGGGGAAAAEEEVRFALRLKNTDYYVLSSGRPSLDELGIMAK